MTAIVLAAGAGTRMKSTTAKVLHSIGGRSMVGHVLNAVDQIDPDQVVAVVGHQREQVQPHIAAIRPGTVFAVQDQQLGTGHAVSVAVDALAVDGHPIGEVVLVVYGDTPLLQAQALRDLLATHTASEDAVTVLTGIVANPTGYGRIVRAEDSTVASIVEEKDATDQQRRIGEVNSGIYVFDSDFLVKALPRVTNNNASGEYYLTDLVALARADGLTVGAHVLDDVMQIEGANDRVQLAALGDELNRRTLQRWMRAGVTVVGPETTRIDVTATLAADVTLAGSVQVLGATTVGENSVIGPFAVLNDTVVEAGTVVPPFTALGAGA